MRKSIIIIIIFICSINNITLNSMIEMYNDFILANIFNDSESNIVEFKVENNYDKELLRLISKYENISIQKDNLNINAYKGKAIYLKDYNHNIPILDGSFFNQDDFADSKNRIVIGKKLLDRVILRENKRYIKFNGIEYEVIGVMGYENRDSILDKSFYLNLNGYLKQKNNNVKETLIISGNDSNTTLLIKDIKEEFTETTLYKNNNLFFRDLMENKITSLFRTILASLCLITCLLIITSNYIYSKKLEIGIRKLYGSSNIKIYIKFIYEYIKILLGGFFISIIINLCIYKMNVFEYRASEKIHILTFIITFLIVIGFGVISSYAFIKKINNSSVCENIEGAEND